MRLMPLSVLPPRRSTGAGWRRRAARLCTTAALLAVSVPATEAEHLNIRVYGAADGLAESTVSALLQDHKGYLWLGTYGGLNRFDGHRFANFSQAEGLPGAFVKALIEDPSGAVWIGTSEGLARFDGGRLAAFTSRDGLSAQSVWSLTVLKSGELLIGTDKGIDVRAGSGFRPYVRFPDGAPRIIASLLQDREGRLWAGTTTDGLWCFEGATVRHFDTAAGVTGWVTTMLEDREGRFWLGTNGGLRQLVGGRVLSPANLLPFLHIPITALIEDRQGALWIGSAAGASRLTPSSTRSFGIGQGLPSRGVDALLADREGNIWFGTDGGGAAVFMGDAFTHYAEADGLASKMVWGFGRDPVGKLWALTSGGPGILIGEGAGSTFAAPPPVLAGTRVTSMHTDRRGRTWLATIKGLYRYDGKWAQIATGSTRDIVEDTDGTLWFGTHAGVGRFRDGRIQIFRDERGGPWINSLYRDSRGILWVGTPAGLLRFDGAKLEGAGALSSALQGMFVLAMAEDANGAMWFATLGHGIVRYQPSRVGLPAHIDSLTTPDLSSNTVYSLLFDHDDHLWLGTNNGLDRLDWRRPRGGGGTRIRHYGTAEGYFGVESNDQASFLDRDGTIWFGTVSGAVHYNPRADHPSALPPVTDLRSVRLFQKSVDWRTRGFALRGTLPEHLTLPHSANSVTFDYVGVSLVFGERVTYSTWLVGSEPDWSPRTYSSSVTYSGLPAGSYSFRVKSCNGDGVCSDAKSLSFIVRPAFWATWWFRSLLFAVLAGTIYAVHHFQMVRLERRRRELEQLVQERTAELGQANDELARLANCDGLTGLANKRCFNERLEEEWRRGQRNGTSLSLVILDIDHFKRFNDTYGHPEGDECLKKVAEVLRRSSRRPADLAARFGGEEFVLLLPETSSAGALKFAQWIRDEVARMAIPHRASTTSDCVTVSVGVASVDLSVGDSPADLVEQADQALYRAKESGRDAVMEAAA